MRFLILLLLIPVHANAFDWDVRNFNTIDGNNYYLTFISRSSEGVGFGHAYVAWGIEDNNKFVCIGDAYGFYPEGGKESWSVIKKVWGEIRNEQISNSGGDINKHFMVIVDKDKYESTKKILNKWKKEALIGKELFILLSNNCKTFVNEIATTIGLKTPKIFSLQSPEEYMKDLINLNIVPVPKVPQGFRIRCN